MFPSLVERSITAWYSLTYVGENQVGVIQDGNTLKLQATKVPKATAIKKNVDILRSIDSLEALLENQQFWFFQLRDFFIRQEVFTKWSAGRLDEYILLPIDYGFANNRDCFFVSHFWRTPHHPDPKGEDLRLIRQDFADNPDQEWSYIWVDWTCMPQGDENGDRSDLEKRYFKKMLRCIPMIVRDCGFTWRFPAFEPRAWILYEVAEYAVNHKEHILTDDNETFIAHLREMAKQGVEAVVKKYGYRCTNKGDEKLVIGWIELLIILATVVPNVGQRQEIFDWINKGEIGKMTIENLGLHIDKAQGVITSNGRTFHFNPVYLSGTA